MTTEIPDFRVPELDELLRMKPEKKRKPGRRLMLGILTAAVLTLLPLGLLLRVSTYLYQVAGTPTWPALGAGALLALIAVTLYGSWISRVLTGKARAVVIAKWVALPLVVLYVGHSLLFLSSVNAKTEEVRAYYTSLHPLLRISVSTLVIFDGSIVITDTAREPEDYERMGLPVYERSLHFRQRDGYVHAMDLRTIGRSAARNWLTQTYFRMLGFRVIRHVGTADHLHVSLPLPSS
jgi:hypothetical protein